MQLPLTQWTLHGDDLPERLFDAPKAPAFSLPGADALDAFADLIGADEQQETAQIQSGVPYALSGLFEADLHGELSLTKEIDFGALCGDRALLMFSHLAGSGEIDLGDVCVARFGQDHLGDLRRAWDMTGMPCALCVDVSDALRLGRRETLRLRFDEPRPAGVMGAAFLSVTSRAHLSRVSVRPDPARRAMTVRARISAQQTGRFVLRVQAVPGGPGMSLPSARETDVTLDAGQARGAEIALSVDAPVFAPGHAYASPAMKIQLFARSQKEKGDGLLCDEALLLCGYGAPAPRAYLPLDEKDCLGDAGALCKSLLDMGIHAVSVPMFAPDALYIQLTRAGIAAVGYVSEEIRPAFTRYPCLTLMDAPLPEENPSPAAAAWQMTGSVAYPRVIDRTMTDEEMLLEASGRRLDVHAQNVCDTLDWLRVVQIRLRAEGARQGRYQGALCSAQERCQRDVMEALHAAFAPVHLSALPLSGAWWTGTHFSASLEAFIPDEMIGNEEIQARAVLEDDDGAELARFLAPCRGSGYMGVIEARLPETPCVLTLRCALHQKGETIEESSLPIYVGERGPLEAAFFVL